MFLSMRDTTKEQQMPNADIDILETANSEIMLLGLTRAGRRWLKSQGLEKAPFAGYWITLAELKPLEDKWIVAGLTA